MPSGAVSPQRQAQGLHGTRPQRLRRQHLHISAKAQHVAQQLAGIGVGHFQCVGTIGMKGALLIGVPFLGLYPTGLLGIEQIWTSKQRPDS